MWRVWTTASIVLLASIVWMEKFRWLVQEVATAQGILHLPSLTVQEGPTIQILVKLKLLEILFVFY